MEMMEVKIENMLMVIAVGLILIAALIQQMSNDMLLWFGALFIAILSLRAKHDRWEREQP